LKSCLGNRSVATGMNDESLSGQTTEVSSIGIRCGSVCSWARKSKVPSRSRNTEQLDADAEDTVVLDVGR
jgi:hypothetical protein